MFISESNHRSSHENFSDIHVRTFFCLNMQSEYVGYLAGSTIITSIHNLPKFCQRKMIPNNSFVRIQSAQHVTVKNKSGFAENRRKCC